MCQPMFREREASIFPVKQLSQTSRNILVAVVLALSNGGTDVQYIFLEFTAKELDWIHVSISDFNSNGFFMLMCESLSCYLLPRTATEASCSSSNIHNFLIISGTVSEECIASPLPILLHLLRKCFHNEFCLYRKCITVYVTK